MPRPNEGTITPQGKGKWKVRVTIPGTTPQRRLSRTVQGSRADAQRVLEHLLAERTVIAEQPQRDGLTTNDPTVGELAERWWATKVEDISPNTAASWRPALDAHVLPAVGHLPIKSVSRKTVAKMVATLRAKGTLGRDRIKTCVTILSGILTMAVEWEYRDDNPAFGYAVKGGQRPMVTAATLPEVHALVDAALRTNPEMAAVVMLAVDTGLRRNELCALRWRDVDLDGGVMVCRHAVVKGGGGKVGGTKGAQMRQTKTGVVAGLTLSEGSVAALRAQYERQTAKLAGLAVDMDATYVFGIIPDRPMYPDTMSTRFAEVRDAAGLPHVQLRALRHSCATLLISEGVDLRTAQGRLRHKRGSTTTDRYADWVPAADARAAATMDRLMDRFNGAEW